MVKLISYLDSNNIKMPGIKPVDDDHLWEITHNFFILAQVLISFSNPNPSVRDEVYISKSSVVILEFIKCKIGLTRN
jgi:hypothetical protein